MEPKTQPLSVAPAAASAAPADTTSELYARRAERMLQRWAGVRQQKPETAYEPQRIVQNRAVNRIDHIARHIVMEQPREVPVLAECEVLVVGGGPSGLSAALGAARAGADVILCERYGCFGGVITTCGMETLGWYRYEGTVESDGVGLEMERLAAQMGGTRKWGNGYNDSPCLDAETFKIVADRLIIENGIRPLLHMIAVEAIMTDGKIKGIITESKSGRQAILAQTVVDCTGDADIANFAGADFSVISKEEALGATSVFNCAGVDKQRFLEYTETNPRTYRDWSRSWQQEGDGSGKEDDLRSPFLDTEFETARKNGIIPDNKFTKEFCGSWSSISEAGEATNLNLVHISNIDVTDVEDLTKAEMDGREQTLHALEALRKCVPGFENAKLRNFGMTLGVRDSRKIVGRYNLTGHDVRSQAKFQDSVGIFPEFVDGYNILILPTTGRYFQVPYGCMIPPKVENLLVAGRAVAGDKVSHAATRNMMCCCITGQAAGVAAAVAVRNESATSTVDIKRVQSELRRQTGRLE
jgi:hypothetical protein